MIRILSQDRTFTRECKGVQIVFKKEEDYRNYIWIVSQDKYQYILGCYRNVKFAEKIIKEINESKGTYEMPINF